MHIRLACVTTLVQEDRMPRLTGKNMVVIGGSRGVGRRIVEAAIRNGARVLAVARQEGPLRQLAQVVSGRELAADPNGVLARTPTIVSQFPDPPIATIRCGRQRSG